MKIQATRIIVFTIAMGIAGCGIKMPPDSGEFYRVVRPDQRANNQVDYFKDEYRQIAEKRRQKSIDSTTDSKPAKLVGLGLSGGGIRSAAYQLGLLDGLHRAKLNKPGSAGADITALDRVDYLSCVSGGCWATGAFLIASEPTTTFFDCLNEQALKGTVFDKTQCGRAKEILRNNQSLDFAGNNTKEKWEDEIRDAYFPQSCREFKFADRASGCWNNLKGKPNAIFNTTHSTLSLNRFGAHIGNLPFQITPDQLGTLVDCGSEGLGELGCGALKQHGAGEGKVGFFVRQDAKDFQWVRRERHISTLWLWPTTNPGSQMSKAMAHASAVVGTPKELSFSMGLTYKGKEPSAEIRNNYLLSDGGFVENLGLLALVERGVDVILLSDMGYPERPKDDLLMAKKQVEKLLKCDVKGIDKALPEQLLSTLTYTCDNVKAGKGNKQGTIIYIRPYPENIGDFKAQLAKDQPNLLACIEDSTHACYGENPRPLHTPDKKSLLENEHRFPLTETMLMTYDERLIRSYYLLGKFIGENRLGPVIDKVLNGGIHALQ